MATKKSYPKKESFLEKNLFGCRKFTKSKKKTKKSFRVCTTKRETLPELSCPVFLGTRRKWAHRRREKLPLGDCYSCCAPYPTERRSATENREKHTGNRQGHTKEDMQPKPQHVALTTENTNSCLKLFLPSLSIQTHIDPGTTQADQQLHTVTSPSINTFDNTEGSTQA